jgi:hypothetical protein
LDVVCDITCDKVPRDCAVEKLEEIGDFVPDLVWVCLDALKEVSIAMNAGSSLLRTLGLRLSTDLAAAVHERVVIVAIRGQFYDCSFVGCHFRWWLREAVVLENCVCKERCR